MIILEFCLEFSSDGGNRIEGISKGVIIKSDHGIQGNNVRIESVTIKSL